MSKLSAGILVGAFFVLCLVAVQFYHVKLYDLNPKDLGKSFYGLNYYAAMRLGVIIILVMLALAFLLR